MRTAGEALDFRAMRKKLQGQLKNLDRKIALIDGFENVKRRASELKQDRKRIVERLNKINLMDGNAP
jgi:hypothetical protein